MEVALEWIISKLKKLNGSKRGGLRLGAGLEARKIKKSLITAVREMDRNGLSEGFISSTRNGNARKATVIFRCHPVFVFFSIRVFFHNHLRITGLQGKREGISLTPHYHFHLLHRNLEISQAITADSHLCT